MNEERKMRKTTRILTIKEPRSLKKKKEEEKKNDPNNENDDETSTTSGIKRLFLLEKLTWTYGLYS